MARTQDRGTETPEQSKTIRVQRFAGRADLFPRLVGMQKAINARNFAVFRLGGNMTTTKRRLVCELENWGPSNSAYSKAFIDAYGDELLDHIDSSMLPLIWNGRDDMCVAEAVDFAPFTVRLKARVLPFSGIAFPVRLGAVGNGYVTFTADYLDISSDTIVDLHSKSCQIMMDLLSLDERRSLPAEVLSEREIACLQLAGDGRISEEIAEKLGLSVHTVNAYLGSATIKLDSVNRIQAIAKAIRLGYIS
ncbi:helix-turn-helix transcriptional regulator [Rhizobiaceae bacterium n13]|uniref:Helix-turn-helix transcriptional regulator n=1 Tax=Ferirhizobium litorale TaxID=2927786 RepID=A0AAE3QFU2_9HYPH|nr:helix-turn-helix transcriptional regulator [Fererhizobium litorale]MDI7863385.1 helix-turn-helix transcriptional regulator [Fererhizobium litorale]MDI7922338.1 helix-turn-helix transcriptional regulator [Fererhizobium litorale]